MAPPAYQTVQPIGEERTEGESATVGDCHQIPRVFPLEKNIKNIQIKSFWDNLRPLLCLGKCTGKFFDFCFFHESVSPKPLSIPLRPFQMFS
jgi:hypothetical protein